MKPSHLLEHPPVNSIVGTQIAERVAHNIIKILCRNGDEWRTLSWQEYKHERQKDHAGLSIYVEYIPFAVVSSYCSNAESARRFSATWSWNLHESK